MRYYCHSVLYIPAWHLDQVHCGFKQLVLALDFFRLLHQQVQVILQIYFVNVIHLWLLFHFLVLWFLLLSCGVSLIFNTNEILIYDTGHPLLRFEGALNLIFLLQFALRYILLFQVVQETELFVGLIKVQSFHEIAFELAHMTTIFQE